MLLNQDMQLQISTTHVMQSLHYITVTQAFGWNFVAEETHFRPAENTFGWIRQDTVLPDALKHCTQVLLVLILRVRSD
jgi:hypothetical protein